MPASEPESDGADLSAYLDGELPAERAAQIERALADAPERRAALEQLRAASAALAGLPRSGAPPELAAALQRAAQAHARAAGPGTRGRRVLRLCMRLTAAAAVMGGSVLVGWEAARYARPGRERPRRVAAVAPQRRAPGKAQAHLPQEARPGAEPARTREAAPATDADVAAQDWLATGPGAGRVAPPAGQAGQALALQPDSAAAGPALAICLRPRSAAEYAAAAGALAEWRQAEAGDVQGASEAELGHGQFRAGGSLAGENAAGGLVFRGELRAAQIAGAVAGLQRRVTAPVSLEAESGHGPAVIWCSGQPAALLDAEAQRMPAVRIVARQGRASEARGARPPAGKSAPAGAAITSAAASAPAAASQSQPAPATTSPAAGAAALPAADSGVLNAVNAWLNSLPRAAGGPEAVRVWIRLVPPARQAEPAAPSEKQ